jgi:hypothetical protein
VRLAYRWGVSPEAIRTLWLEEIAAMSGLLNDIDSKRR